MSNNAIDEPCEGFLCSPKGTCNHHSVNVSEIEGRGHEDIIEPPVGSVVLVEGVALQRGLIPNDDEGGWTYFYDLQPQYAQWKHIATRSVLISEADENWREGSVWLPGMPSS